ncbi:uncharacterized protein N7515_002146 [Penicillium bovifimosum]|uniref:Uncharacterized protein n=1 Tax=Penicillium bovifimosum TaxID=126998 RepID=A0A9W9HBB2_9EURO|nr:uncharacterized protein N7515_002146 [Penicillium bovifimosum]KAJ5143359.1 hypothetical protein N7515_002146 [Penicillium bovifimosum]
MPIPTRSASLREPRKHTSNIARPTTKPSTTATTTAGPSRESTRETKDNSRQPSDSSPVEGVSSKDNGLIARGKTLLPQRSIPGQDNGRGTGQVRFQPPGSKPNTRRDASPTRQQERLPTKKQVQPAPKSTKPGVTPSRRQSLMRSGTLNPVVKTTVPLSQRSASSFTPPSPRKQAGRQSPTQTATLRRPPSPKKSEMLPPPRPTRSASMRQPVSAGKGPPAVARTHTRHKSQLVQSAKQAEPTPATGQRPRLLPTYQRPSSPKKFSKPPTPTPGTNAQSSNLLIPSSWPDIAALQTELLQLSLFHSNSLQRHTHWKSDTESCLRKKYDDIAGQYRSVLADETQRQYKLNIQALELWLSSCHGHPCQHDFSDQVQILSGILQDVSDMISGVGGGEYSRTVEIFENWLNQAELVRHGRVSGDVDIDIFIDPLTRGWQESLHALIVKLELCARQLQVLDIPAFEGLEQSALARASKKLAELIQFMLQEIRAIRTLEAEIVRSERDSVSLVATRLAGPTREIRAPRVGVWRS